MTDRAVISELVSLLIGITFHIATVVFVMACFIPDIGVFENPNIPLGTALLWVNSFLFPYLFGYITGRLLCGIFRNHLSTDQGIETV